MMRILHILPVLPAGGVGAYLKNIISKIDSVNYKIEVLISSDIRDDSLLTFFTKQGILVHFVNGVTLKRTFKIMKQFKKFFIDNQYDIVEIHATNIAFMCAKYAAKYGKAKVIYHEHNTLYSFSKLKSVRNSILTSISKKHADAYIACGDKVAEIKFFDKGILPKNVCIFPNPIIIQEVTNYNLKEELGYHDKKLCLAMGILSNTKNHQYLLEIFKSLLNRTENVQLLIAGEGELRCRFEQYIADNKLTNVTLLGFRNDVANLMNACDLLLMPSLFEGLPVTVLEAQSFGLPCALSDRITNEMVINDNLIFLPIDECSKELWCNAIVDLVKTGKATSEKFLHSRYNIDNSINFLEKTYSRIIIGEDVCINK